MSRWNLLRTGGSSQNVPPCRGASLRGRTRRKLWTTSKRPSPPGFGRRTRRPWRNLNPARTSSKLWWPCNTHGQTRQHLREGSCQSFREGRLAVAGQVGSHVVMIKTGIRANLCVPQHKELSVGTLRALIRHAGLSVDEFLNLL